MDRKRIMQEAKKWSGPGKAYVHAEYQDGVGAENIISGEFIGLMNIICSIMDRMADLTGTTVKEVAETAVLAHDGIRMQVLQEGEKIGGDAYDEDIRNQIREEVKEQLERQYRFEINAEIKAREKAVVENVGLNSTIKRLQEKIEAVRKAASLDVDELQRKIRAKESEIRELQKRLKEAYDE